METPAMDIEQGDIEHSESLNEFAAALAKAQAEIKNAKKSSDNPFFKSKYADLAEVSDACRGPLTKNGIAVLQAPINRGRKVGVKTMLIHSSGQWVKCPFLATPKDEGPQAVGSVVTYLRRYSLAGMAGVATEDDDGERAEGRDKDAKPPGANWGRERSTPKASGPARGVNADSGASKPTTTITSRATPAPLQSVGATAGANDTGEVLDPGQLQDLTEAFSDKWGKGARTAAPSWLKAKFGTDNVASLTKAQATEALGELLASAS